MSSDEKQRLKRDMCPPQATNHPDHRMHLTLGMLFHLSAHPKITYPLVIEGTNKMTEDK
jgi:hypothetical protein